jgi:hypothetical protein
MGKIKVSRISLEDEVVDIGEYNSYVDIAEDLERKHLKGVFYSHGRGIPTRQIKVYNLGVWIEGKGHI